MLSPSPSPSPEQERSKLFLVALVSALPKPIRSNIDRFLEKRILDQEIHKLMLKGQFPDWFGDQVHWDPLCGKCMGVRRLFRLAVSDRLMEMDSSLRYRVILNPDRVGEILIRVGVDEKKFRALLKELGQALFKVPPDIIKLSGAARKQHVPGEEGESENDVYYDPL